MIVRAQAGADSLDAALRNRGGWLAVGLAAGAVLPVQGAVNAQLRADVDAPITVGAFSFLVATATMAVVLAAVLALGRSGRPTGTRLRGVPWWGWLGGACGATYVTSVFVLIPEIGVAPTVALTVAGQRRVCPVARRGRPDPAGLERAEQVHRVAIGVVHERVALAPRRIEGFLVTVVAERHEPLVGGVDVVG